MVVGIDSVVVLDDVEDEVVVTFCSIVEVTRVLEVTGTVKLPSDSCSSMFANRSKS